MRRWARRPLTIGGYLLAAPLLVTSLPLSLPLALARDLLSASRLATTRLLLFAVAYLVCESIGLLASLWLWVEDRLRPDPARRLTRLYSLQWHWAGWLFGSVRRLFGLRVRVTGGSCVQPGPVLVFVRHASLADVLLPAVFLSGPRGLRLRYVMKRELLWDPCLDVVGGRLPNLFVRRESGQGELEARKVARLAQGLGRDEGVVIFPEGTRFTPERRARALARIAAAGDALRLTRARALHHVLPPRTGGALALLEACPRADVLVVAHVGFDGISHVRDVLDGRLVGRTVRLHVWRESHHEVPRDPAKRVEWIDALWRRVDDWIEAQPGQ